MHSEQGCALLQRAFFFRQDWQAGTSSWDLGSSCDSWGFRSELAIPLCLGSIYVIAGRISTVWILKWIHRGSNQSRPKPKRPHPLGLGDDDAKHSAKRNPMGNRENTLRDFAPITSSGARSSARPGPGNLPSFSGVKSRGLNMSGEKPIE